MGVATCNMLPFSSPYEVAGLCFHRRSSAKRLSALAQKVRKGWICPGFDSTRSTKTLGKNGDSENDEPVQTNVSSRLVFENQGRNTIRLEVEQCRPKIRFTQLQITF